uniref:Uncharacterized protein n=1 Tax=Arundo donax TaxID=35708 RepID=A0A0A9FJ40_ARUDO
MHRECDPSTTIIHLDYVSHVNWPLIHTLLSANYTALTCCQADAYLRAPRFYIHLQCPQQMLSTCEDCAVD